MGGARLSGTTVEAPAGKYNVYAQIRDSAGHVRYSYLRTQLTITTPPASLNFVTSNNGTIDIAGTSGNDRIYVTTNGTSIGATLHDFTQIMSLTGVTSVRVHGGEGDDRLVLGDGVRMALVLGEGGHDTLIGADGDDRLEGGTGRDQLYGNGGADRLSGGGGNDYLNAGSGSDRLYGDAGNDYLVGGAGNDRLFGGSGSDFVDGGVGDADRAGNDPLDQFSNVEILFD
jgi:Ca2+-binding RTX toxin-like protein